MFLGPVIEKWNGFIKTHPNVVSSEAGIRFTQYLHDITGVLQLSEQQIRSMSQSLFKALRLKNVPASVIDSLMKGSYVAALGWRAYPMIRNLSQPFLTLAPRIGNSWIADAMKLVTDDKLGLLYKEAVHKLIIPPDIPLFESGEIFGRGSKMDAFASKTLAGIQNGDIYNRLVSYNAVKLAYDDAMRIFNLRVNTKTPMTLDEFFNKANLNQLPPDLIPNVKQMLSKGDFVNPKELLADTLTRETQIEYTRGLNPLLFRGALGRLFGQFGTYTVHWIQNIRNGFTRAGSLPQKLLFLSRFAANSAAFYGVATALGIQGADFIPGPVAFAGGPWFHIVTTLPQLIGSSYQSRQARANMIGVTEKDGLPHFDIPKFMTGDLMRSVIPGSLEFRAITKALEYANKGDYYRFFLSLGSAPIRVNK
jgi:hypothetical protein